MKRIISFIDRYEPMDIDLGIQLKPFIPEFIPCVGDIDGFMKPRRPDGTIELSGLAVLDEPCGNQSDPQSYHCFT
jgi:intraflagellar transport protein 46